MNDEISTIEQTIKKLTNSQFGEKFNIVLNLNQIEEIPIDNFEKLQELLRSGSAILRQYPLSTGSGTFDVISTNAEKRSFNLVSALSILIPILGIILSFVYSWWFLLLVLSPIITTRFGKRIYLRALFNRAANSEIAFCFLFCGNCITLELPGHGIIERKP